jgi:hypothetical protein
MPHRFFTFVLLAFSVAVVPIASGAEPTLFHPVACEGAYPRHVQGVCTNERDAIYWSWTDAMVKTDREGRILKKVPAADHHGDLCYHDGKVYVAVNLGKFNEPAGKADSWVYVYDADTLAELARHPVPELVHGAGGMACHDGKFIIVGGLPDGVNENYLYEYDKALKFVKRHVLASGHTHLGIQTVAFADGAWWFGCYGKPKLLLRADPSFRFTGKWEFDGSYGIVPLGQQRFLIAQNTVTRNKGNEAKLVAAQADAEKGIVLKPDAEKLR